jgi:hypothetical protein
MMRILLVFVLLAAQAATVAAHGAGLAGEAAARGGGLRARRLHRLSRLARFAERIAAGARQPVWSRNRGRRGGNDGRPKTC